MATETCCVRLVPADHIVVMTDGGRDNAATLLLYYIVMIGFRFWAAASAAAPTVDVLLLTLLAPVQFGVPARRIYDR